MVQSVNYIFQNLLRLVRMYYGSGTVDRIASRWALSAYWYAAAARCVDATCTLIRWQHFCVKWRHGRHLENLMPSIDVYLLEQSSQFHPDPIWNDEALGFFEEVDRPNKNNNRMSSDMRSVRSSWSKNKYNGPVSLASWTIGKKINRLQTKTPQSYYRS